MALTSVLQALASLQPQQPQQPDPSQTLAQLQPRVDQTPLAPAPQSGAPSLSSGDVASAVPQFTPAPNLVEHHGLLQRIGQSVQGFAQRAGTAVAGIDPAVAQNLSPEQLAQARKAALFHLGASMLSNTADRYGRGTTFLERLGGGLEAGRTGAEQSTAGSIAANNYNIGLATTQRIQQARNQVAKLWDHQEGDDDLTKTQKLDRLEKGVVSLTAVGDDAGAKALDGAIKAWQEGRTSASAASPFAPVNQGDAHTVYRKADGMYLQPDGTWKQSLTTNETPWHRTETWDSHSLQREGHAINVAQHVETLSKPLLAENVPYNNFVAVALESKNGTPEAYKSALINYLAALDPKAQVRSKMLEFASRVDPSIGGSFDTMMQRLQNGTFPKEQLEGMLRVAERSHNAYRDQYKVLYDEAVRNNPSSQRYLASPEAAFFNASTPKKDLSEY